MVIFFQFNGDKFLYDRHDYNYLPCGNSFIFAPLYSAIVSTKVTWSRCDHFYASFHKQSGKIIPGHTITNNFVVCHARVRVEPDSSATPTTVQFLNFCANPQILTPFQFTTELTEISNAITVNGKTFYGGPPIIMDAMKPKKEPTPHVELKQNNQINQVRKDNGRTININKATIIDMSNRGIPVNAIPVHIRQPGIYPLNSNFKVGQITPIIAPINNFGMVAFPNMHMPPKFAVNTINPVVNDAILTSNSDSIKSNCNFTIKRSVDIVKNMNQLGSQNLNRNPERVVSLPQNQQNNDFKPDNDSETEKESSDSETIELK